MRYPIIVLMVIVAFASAYAQHNPRDVTQDILKNPIEISTDVPYHLQKHEPIEDWTERITQTFTQFDLMFKERFVNGYDLIEAEECRRKAQNAFDAGNVQQANELMQLAWNSLALAEKFRMERSDKRPQASDYTVLGPFDWPDDAVRIEVVSYTSDGLKVYGVVMRPAKEGKYPLIMWNHGGTAGLYPQSFGWLARLIKEEGYVIMLAAYRGEPLFGAGFRSADPAMAASYERYSHLKCEDDKTGRIGAPWDILNLMACGKQLPFVDAERIGIMGGSAGGRNTLDCLTKCDEFDVAICCAGYMNFFRRYMDRELVTSGRNPLNKPEFLSMSFAEKSRWLAHATPMTGTHLIGDTPVLIMVGDHDQYNLWWDNLDFAQEMIALGKHVEVEVYPGQIHGFYFMSNFDRYPETEPAYQRMKAFLAKYLKD